MSWDIKDKGHKETQRDVELEAISAVSCFIAGLRNDPLLAKEFRHALSLEVNKDIMPFSSNLDRQGIYPLETIVRTIAEALIAQDLLSTIDIPKNFLEDK